MRRRGLLRAFLAAPAIIRTPGLLMPIRPVEEVFTFSGFETLIPSSRLYGELLDVTHRSFAPSLAVQIYDTHPLLTKLIGQSA